MHRFVTVYGCHEFGWTEVAASAIHGACKVNITKNIEYFINDDIYSYMHSLSKPNNGAIRTELLSNGTGP